MVNFIVALNKNKCEKIREKVDELDGVKVLEEKTEERLVEVSILETADENEFKKTMNAMPCVYAINKKQLKAL